VIAVPSLVMRSASHLGTRPPWRGRSATPDLFMTRESYATKNVPAKAQRRKGAKTHLLIFVLCSSFFVLGFSLRLCAFAGNSSSI